jgi:tetratricopeptide (TPR) repeat protein
MVVSDALIERLDAEDDPNQLMVLGDAFIAKGRALFNEERWDEAIALFDALVKRFQDSTDSKLRGRAAVALSNKTAALGQSGRMKEAIATQKDMATRFGEDAIAAFDEIAQHFEHATDPALREQIVGVLFNKAAVLSELERRREAVRVFAEIIDRFEDDDNPRIEHVVGVAREAREQLLEDDNHGGDPAL